MAGLPFCARWEGHCGCLDEQKLDQMVFNEKYEPCTINNKKIRKIWIKKTFLGDPRIRQGPQTCAAATYEMDLKQATNIKETLLQEEVGMPTVKVDCSFLDQGLCSHPLFGNTKASVLPQGSLLSVNV